MKAFRSAFASMASGALLIAAATSHAAMINTDATITDNIPGLTGFQTNGDLMGGMDVTMLFAGGVSDSAVFSAGVIGDMAGSATGTGWTLAQSGDTFANLSWMVSNNSGLSLIGMVLDGRNGLTVFDRSDDSGFAGQGTPGSASGTDFSTDLTDDGSVSATYSRAVAVIPAGPVGDIWHVLTVDLSQVNNGVGIRSGSSFQFRADTDNDSRRIQVPEPGTLALLGLGLAGLAALRHRKL